MSAQDLTFAEIITATTMMAGDGPPGRWWRESEVGRIFDPDFRVARDLIARAPSESSEAGRLLLNFAEADADHDEDVRFGHGVLDLTAQYHWDPAMRNEAAELKALFYPDGLLLIGKSYAEEAGRGVSRAAVLTPGNRARLARITIPQGLAPTGPTGPANLADWMDAEQQRSSARLAELVAARSRLGEGVVSPTELLDTKRRFLALMKQIFSTFRILDARLTESDRVKLNALKDIWNDSVRSATERAKRRREARPGTPAPTPST